jgi:probable rRNA maturation factor
MDLVFVNESRTRVPRLFLQNWLKNLTARLPAKDRKRLKPGLQMTLVFLSRNRARQLNQDYRGKDYATDVLSFGGDGIELFGELAFCPEVLARQAKEHGLSYRAELAYMTLHGVLHLLGYDHETDARQARRMYRLQDKIFAELQHLHSKS